MPMNAAVNMEISSGEGELADLVKDVRRNAERVNAASRQRAGFVAELIERSRSISGEIADLRRQSYSSQDKLSVTADAAESIIEEVQSIVDLMDRSVQGISAFHEKVLAFKTRFEEVNAVSNAIVEVADRTKILSINAMIEAARAGEHGRGFQVVANEVRELATSTGSSAELISTHLSQLLSDSIEMSKECAELHRLATEGNNRGQANLEGLKAIHVEVLNSASDANGASQSTGEQIEMFADLVSGMERLQQDTEEAIAGSARNIEITTTLEQRIAGLPTQNRV